HRLYAGRDVALLAYQVISAPHGVFRVLLGLFGPALFEQALRLLQAVGGLPRLCPTVGAVGRGLPHGVGRLLETPRGVGQVLPLLALSLGLAAQLLELPRGPFDFLGQRALLRGG